MYIIISILFDEVRFLHFRMSLYQNKKIYDSIPSKKIYKKYCTIRLLLIKFIIEDKICIWNFPIQIIKF